jgi:hypothetical protein
MLRLPRLCCLLAFCVLLFGCSNAPKTSLGEQQFGDAKNSLKSSDFKAALNNLNGTIKNADNDALRQQAILLRVALVTALANSNEQMAEAYKAGAKMPLAYKNTTAFARMRSDYYTQARAYLMDAMQSVMDQRSKLNGPVNVELAFPGFTGGVDAGLAKIKNGELIGDAERLGSEQQLVRNSLAQVLAGFAGAGQDLNKARDIFNAGKVDVDPRLYIVVLSDNFLHIGAMFDKPSLNDADKLRTVNQVVEGNLVVATKLLAAKPDKDMETHVKKMQADCDKCLKKLGA